MKRFLTTILIIISAIGCIYAGNGAGIAFSSDRHEFGNIREKDGKATCEFRFVNNGDAPLVIISATASCGCTKPEYPKKPIAPGDSASIKVSYNPKGRPGEFAKTIKVTTNAAKDKTVKLKITGTVIPEK